MHKVLPLRYPFHLLTKSRVLAQITKTTCEDPRGRQIRTPQFQTFQITSCATFYLDSLSTPSSPASEYAVCKIWHNLILEPYLAKLHLSRSPLSLVFFRHGNSNKYPSYFEILQLHDPPDLDQHNATMKFRTEIYSPDQTYVQIVASCNGSILLSNYASRDEFVIIVCNPLRAHHLILPEPPKLSLETHSLAGLGLVHSPSTDKYKVLVFTCTHSPARLYCDTFTIGIDDEWRSIEDTGKPPADFPSQFIFLNGAFHWIGIENSPVICYFNIEKEKFGSFPLPSHFASKIRMCLGVVDNWLYIHQDYRFRFGEWKFWVMKDYGDHGSWTLEWVIKGIITYEFDISVKLLKMLIVERWNPVDDARNVY